MIEIEMFIDELPLVVIVLGSFALMILAIEIGYRFGNHWPGKQAKAQPAQVRALMGAGLGLVGFMLAFGFSIAQSHFEVRAQAYLEEVRAISSIYMSAGLLDEEKSQQARNLISEFVDGRVEIMQNNSEISVQRVMEIIDRGEQLHEALWALGQSHTKQLQAGSSNLFTESVIRLIEANEQRKQAALYNRVSPVIWLTLILISILAMVITGYQAGLTGSHSRLATWSLAITFSAVIALVMDLDRPRMTLFSINQQQMVDMKKHMDNGHQYTIPR